MALTVSEPDSTFEPAPEGLHTAVCCDVVDLGLVTNQWGTQHKVSIRWQLDATMADGRRYVVAQRYTASLHKKANLRRDLETWRGQRFTEEERRGFDLELLLGVSCQLQIIHNTTGEQTYANVQAVLPAPRGVKLDVTEDYIREKDRTNGQPPPQEPEQGQEQADDWVPF